MNGVRSRGDRQRRSRWGIEEGSDQIQKGREGRGGEREGEEGVEQLYAMNVVGGSSRRGK
jgi:hypothetical protein